MLLPIVSQIEQKALVERSARSLRRAARVSLESRPSARLACFAWASIVATMRALDGEITLGRRGQRTSGNQERQENANRER
jgi:hypothetical protein